MKKIVLLVMVFITSFLNAQSVDPETFPTVTGNLLNKNVYTNTGGEGKFSISSIKVLDTTSISYADFYQKITNSQLITGMTYIIVDFQTIYDQPDYDASGNPKATVVTKISPNIEKIWVLALSSNQIADRAYSATFPKDQIKYDWTFNTTEINGSPAMGRISERIDDKGNRSDYDHREILFKRYDDGTGLFNQWKDNGNSFQEFLTFSSGSSNNFIGDFKQYNFFYGIPFILANNVLQNTCLSNTFGKLDYNITLSSNTISSMNIGDGNRDILIKGSGLLLKSSIGNQNQNMIITDGEFEIGSNNSNIVLNSNNNDFNIHKIGNQCSNISVGNLGCIQIEDNSSDIIIADGGVIIATNAINVNLGLNSSIYGKGFLNNVSLGDNGEIFFDFELVNINIGNNSDKLRLFGTCQNITFGDNVSGIFLKNCNTIDLATDCRNQVIENSGGITIASNIGVNGGCYIQFSGNLIIGTNNELLYFNYVLPNAGIDFMTIGNNNKNCKFYGEFEQFTDGGVNDLNNMRKCNFNFMDDTGWTNGINPTNTPEIYLDNSEKWIFKGNGNFYEKHFNGTTDVFTILN